MENNFSAENSLRLISETIERSRRTIAKNMGKPLIFWGILVSVTAFIVWMLWAKTGNAAWNFLWFAMTAAGFVGGHFLSRDKEKVPESEISRILGKIWIWFGIIAIGLFVLAWVAWGIRSLVGIEGALKVDLSLILVALMGYCGTLSGTVLKFKPITIMSVVATALSVLFLMVMPEDSAARILTFLILGVFALIVPGIILQKKGR